MRLEAGFRAEERPWNEQTRKRKALAPVFVIAILALGLPSPAVTAAQLKPHTDQQMIEELLIGAFVGNAQLNSCFDGPFDQLPDNSIEGGTLIDALLER